MKRGKTGNTKKYQPKTYQQHMMTMLAACDVGHSGVKGYMDGQEARAAWKKGHKTEKTKDPWFVLV